MVLRIAREIERYIIELGAEGRLIRLQLEELMVDVREDRRAVLADYLPDFADLTVDEVAATLASLHREELLSLARVAELLGYAEDVDALELHVSPRGYRMLRKIPRLPRAVIANLVGAVRPAGGHHERRRPTSWPPSKEWARAGRTTSRRASFASGSSTCWSGTASRREVIDSWMLRLTSTADDGIECIESVAIVRVFQEGDKVVYPLHGAGASRRSRSA